MSRSFGYDRANRVKLVENRANGLSERFEYDYDLNGNRSAERRYREGTLLRALTFGYDLLDQMQTVTDGTRSISYSYDDVGNRLTETGTRLDGTAVSYTYRYDGANRLQDIQDGTGTILASYGHDANGNITSITRGNESWNYDYDIREQMIRASRTVTQTQPETEAGYYSYDFGKRRIGRNWDSDGWTWSVYGQDSVVSEYDAAGSQQNRYEYAGGAVVRGEQDGYYFSDAQGSVTFVAGTEPQVTRTEYDPWGVILSGARDGSTISYTGQWRDDQTGLMPLGNGERYYDPLLGRFIQEDSFAGMDTLPQSLNRYAYVHNNPLGFIDPSGHERQGVLGQSAEAFGINQYGETSNWGIAQNTIATTSYDLWNLVSFGALERQEHIVEEFDHGRLSTAELWGKSAINAGVSFAQLGVAIATGYAGAGIASSGMSLGGRFAAGAVLGMGEKFVGESLEIATGFRQEYSSAGDYLLMGALGGAGELVGAGINRIHQITEGTKTISAGLKALKREAVQEVRSWRQSMTEMPPVRATNTLDNSFLKEEQQTAKQIINELDSAPLRGTGHLGGIRLTEGMMDAIEKRLKKMTPLGEEEWRLVRNADEFLIEREARAGFDPRTGTMYLKSGATYADYFHEITHAKQRAQLGLEKYLALRRYDREMHVFDEIMRHHRRFTPAELERAFEDALYYENRFGRKTLYYLLGE